MKKNLLIAIAALALSSHAFAAAPDAATLEKYVRRASMVCPGSTFSVKAVAQPPAGFNLYRVTQTSTDPNCSRNAYLAVSPLTGMTLFGDAFQLPAGGTIDSNLKDLAGRLLKKTVTVKVGAPEGKEKVRRGTIITPSRIGPFEYHGWIDSAGKYFIVGRKGNINVDAGETFLAAIGAPSAVTRGNSMGRVRIVELSDFECPTCQRAHLMLEPFIKKNLGKISYSRLDLSLFEHHEWSFDAAMGARAIQKVAPNLYWEYVDSIFTNQEITNAGNVKQMIMNFAEDHDIPWSKVEPFYSSAADRKALLSQISKAFDNGVLATPTFIVNGQMIFFGTDGEHIRTYLERAVSGK
jgi:protein-disulfide isomerase